MNTNTHKKDPGAHARYRYGALVMLAAIVMAVGAAPAANAAGKGCRHCRLTAHLALRSSLTEARADYWLAAGKAMTIPDREERREAVLEAREELKEATEEAREQYHARVELCGDLEECRYHPEIDPENFCSPEEIAADPNPYWPMVPGTTYTYEGETEDGPETIVVEVTDDTREILGVTCIVIRDTVWVDGEMVEDTRDWYGQDKDGNVWYFGELSVEFEDGEISALEGSWEWGEDGAKPGIVMWADPEVGQIYRQEFLLGEAEDAGEVESLDDSVSVPYGDFDGCLRTGEFTPLEPDVYENKFYKAGIGLLKELDVESGEMVELVSIETD